VDNVALVLEVEAALRLVSVPDAKRLPYSVDVLSLLGLEEVVDVMVRGRGTTGKVEGDAGIDPGDEELVRSKACDQDTSMGIRGSRSPLPVGLWIP
jgi:hypothetical protein